MSKELSTFGYPEKLYMINAILRTGKPTDETYSELPMTEYMSAEDESGKNINLILLRLFSDESQANQYKDFVKSNTSEENIIDYVAMATRTSEIPLIKDRMLTNLEEKSLTGDETPNKLCIVLCSFDGESVHETQIIFQNVNKDLEIYPN